MKLLKRLIREDDGATMVEYGLLIALIAVAVIGVVTAIGGQLNTLFGQVRTALTGAGGGGAP